MEKYEIFARLSPNSTFGFQCHEGGRHAKRAPKLIAGDYLPRAAQGCSPTRPERMRLTAAHEEGLAQSGSWSSGKRNPLSHRKA